MVSTIKTKYTNLTFIKEVISKKTCFWASVGFSHKSKDDPRAVAFYTLMDEKVLNEVLDNIVLPLKDSDIEAEAYLEGSALILVLPVAQKHLASKLIGILTSAEAEFDSLIKSVKPEKI